MKENKKERVLSAAGRLLHHSGAIACALCGGSGAEPELSQPQ